VEIVPVEPVTGPEALDLVLHLALPGREPGELGRAVLC
jgi:hypothetical protein